MSFPLWLLALAIEGRVVDATGTPVAAALVAAFPETPGVDALNRKAAAIGQSGTDGRFRLEPLGEATFSVTATAAGHAAAAATGVAVGSEGTRTLTLVLSGGGATVSGRIVGHDPLPRQVLAHRYDGPIFVANAEGGAYSFTLPSGDYLFLAQEGPQTGYSVVTVGADDEHRDLVLGDLSPPPAAVVQWLRKEAVRLATTEPGEGLVDLRPLKKIVGSARLVALGEATHGTRELYRVRHRVFELLAEEMGLTAIAIEAAMPGGFDVDDYVSGRSSVLPRTLAYFKTQELTDVIEWMRAYNADPKHRRKLRFYGFDTQPVDRSTRAALDYLRRVDPEAASEAGAALAFLADFKTQWDLEARSADEKRAVRSAVERMLATFERRRKEYAGASSESEWRLARQYAALVQQNVEMRLAPAGEEYAVRDRAMARNVEWILKNEGPGTRVAIWAHNGHVASRPEALGDALRKALGRDLVVFGLEMNQGGFQALGHVANGGVLEPEQPMIRRSFAVGPAPEGSLASAFVAAGLPLAAIDLRRAPAKGPVADWLDAPHESWHIGSGFIEGFAPTYWSRVRPREAYDAVLFVDRTTPTRSPR